MLRQSPRPNICSPSKNCLCSSESHGVPALAFAGAPFAARWHLLSPCPSSDPPPPLCCPPCFPSPPPSFPSITFLLRSSSPPAPLPSCCCACCCT
eukprot:1577661-Rhodomonas_salina.2